MARKAKVPIEKTMKRVDLTLKKIGDFLKKWESVDAKPDQMVPEISRLKRFRDALAQWKRQAGSSKSEAEREKLIREFVLICETYS